MAKTNKPPVKSDDAPKVVPKIVYRDQVEADHHLFKAKVAKCLKSDKYGPVKLKSVEHVHFFHTINSDGSEQHQTPAIAGHVHEVTWRIDEEGNLVAKCGPPLKKVIKAGRGGLAKVTWERIRVKDEDNNILEDNHQHEMEYMGSEKISQSKIQQIQQANSAKLGQMGVRPEHVKPDVEVKKPEDYDVSDANGDREVT